MKLRNIFTALAVAAIAFVGCQKESRFLDEVQVSKSIVALPLAGGSETVTVTATADWTLELPDNAWFTVDLASGAAGVTQVTFSAEAATATREASVSLVCAGATQYIKVLQMAEKVDVPLSTCAEVNAGESGKRYRIKGTVTSIANTLYGNMYITDETGTVYVYGTLNNGAEKEFAGLGIEVGDIVVVEGPMSPYNGSPQLKNVDVISIEKSLLKVEKVSPTGPLCAEGDVFTVTLTNKGGDLEISIPEADQTWLTYSKPFVSGTISVVEFTAAANPGLPRSTTVTFSTESNGVNYTAVVDMEQNGAIPEATVAEAIASGEICSVLGKVLFAHAKGVLITDGKDVLYGYLGATPEVAVGDVVKMIGTVTKYNGGRSMNKPTVEKAEGVVASYTAPTPVTLDAAKFAEYTSSTADFATPYVMITGVAESDNYGNLIVKLVDGETTYSVKSYYANESYADWAGKEVKAYGYAYNAYADSKQVNVLVTSVMDAAAEGPQILTLTNAEILAALAAANSTSTSYVDYTIESASGVWAVNASQLNTNTFLQCRGKKGSYIKTPAFDKDIKSVTIHFTTAKSVYANNVYCAFPATWTAPTEDAQYPETGNVGKATTDGSYSLTIPVAAGNKQVYVSIIGTYSYYLDHIDVEL